MFNSTSKSVAMNKINPTTSTIKSYLGAIVSIVFVIMLVLSFAPFVTAEESPSNGVSVAILYTSE